MTEEMIKAIALQIVNEQLLQNWKFYLLILSFGFLSAVGSAYISSYMKKRGEYFATRADFEAMLDQVKKTTSAAEKIRADISHLDWSSREWKTIRRVKLEELLTTLYQARDWMSREKNAHIFGENPQECDSPMIQASIIARLYFPELFMEVLTGSSTFSEMQSLMAQAVVEKLAAGNDQVKVLASVKKYSEEWCALYVRLIKEISDIENKVHEVVKTIAA